MAFNHQSILRQARNLGGDRGLDLLKSTYGLSNTAALDLMACRADIEAVPGNNKQIRVIYPIV